MVLYKSVYAVQCFLGVMDKGFYDKADHRLKHNEEDINPDTLSIHEL